MWQYFILNHCTLIKSMNTNKKDSMFIPGEPPNRTPQHVIESLDPSTAPPGGEDITRSSQNMFEDTGNSMESFSRASKQVAQLLKKA